MNISGSSSALGHSGFTRTARYSEITFATGSSAASWLLCLVTRIEIMALASPRISASVALILSTRLCAGGAVGSGVRLFSFEMFQLGSRRRALLRKWLLGFRRRALLRKWLLGFRRSALLRKWLLGFRRSALLRMLLVGRFRPDR